MSRSIPSGTCVSINLDATSLARIKDFCPPELPLVEISPDQGDDLTIEPGQGVYVICGWDGVRGRTARFLAEFRANWANRFHPVFGIDNIPTDAERSYAQEVGVSRWFQTRQDGEDIRQVFRKPARRPREIELYKRLEEKLSKALKDADFQTANEAIHSLLILDARTETYALILGRNQEVRGDSKAAVDVYKRILMSRPDYVKAHYLIGSVLKKVGLLNDAYSHFAEGWTYAGGYADLMLAAGKVAMDQDNELAKISRSISGGSFAVVSLYEHAETEDSLSGLEKKYRFLVDAVEKTTMVEVRNALRLALSSTAFRLGKKDEAREIRSQAVDVPEEIWALLKERFGSSIEMADAEASKAPRKLSFSPAGTLDSSEVIGQLEKNYEEDYVVESHFVSEENLLVSGPVFAFHPNPTGGESLASRLADAGCGKVFATADPTKLYARARARSPELLAIWIEKENLLGIDVVRGILEARDIPLPVLVVVCPGPDALQELERRGQDLLINNGAQIEFSRASNAAIIKQALADFQKAESPSQCIRQLRDARKGSQKPDDNAIKKLLKGALAAPGKKAYWGHTELCAYALENQNFQVAVRTAKGLLEFSGNSFDARLLHMVVRAEVADVETAVTEFIGAMAWKEELTPERALKVGLLLVGWKQLRSFQLFLERWYQHIENKEGPERATLFYLASLYSEQSGEDELSFQFLLEAASLGLDSPEVLNKFDEFLEKRYKSGQATRLRDVRAKICGTVST